MMKISAFELLPLRITASSAEETDGSREVGDKAVIIILSTDGGVTGFGEATSLRGLGIGALTEWLRAYGGVLTGANALNINAAHRLMDSVTAQRSASSQRARAAFDMAIHDVIGKVRASPVHQLLGGAYRSDFERGAELDHKEPADRVHQACELVRAGFRGLKIRAVENTPGVQTSSHQLSDGVRTIRGILESVSPDIYVTANFSGSGMNASLVVRTVQHLLSDRFFPNLSIEQPLDSIDLVGHAFLRERLPIPVVLADSVTSPEMAISIVQMAAADRVVINLGRVGGLLPAMRIAEICEAAAIAVSVEGAGGMGLSDAAHGHLAATIRDPYPLCLNDEADPRRSLGTGCFDVQGALVSIPGRPGLGVELDPDRLRTFSASL